MGTAAKNVGRLPLVWFESEWEVGVATQRLSGWWGETLSSPVFGSEKIRARRSLAPPISGLGRRVSRFSAFTLIELLVVIGVIAILAGFLLPTLVGVKTRAKAKIAKSEMKGLEAAIAQYESEYSRVPLEKEAVNQLLNPAVTVKDFTYGGTLQDNTTTVESYSMITYKANNAKLIAILQSEGLATTPAARGLSFTNNPRKITFFEAKRVDTTGIGGIGPDGVLRDPWGTPYFVTVDVDGNEKVVEGFYGRILTKLGTNDISFRAPVAVWSPGPDLRANATIGPKDFENKDNVVTWD